MISTHFYVDTASMRVTSGWQAAVSSQQYYIYLPESCWTRPLFPTREKDTWTWQMGQKSIGLLVFYQTLWETHDHYSDVIKRVMASQTTSAPIVCSVVQVQIKENIKTLRHCPLCGKIHRSPVNSPHTRPVSLKMFTFDDVIMDDE